MTSEVERNHDVEGGIFRETRLASVVSKMFTLSEHHVKMFTLLEHHVRVASVPLNLFFFLSFSFACFFVWFCFLPELSCGVVRYFFWMY